MSVNRLGGEAALLTMSSGRRWAVTAGVMMGMFLAALEATVVSTAMPTVIASLGGLSHYSWVFSAYLITSTVTVPVWGKLSDLYGRRLFYQVGIAVFLLGSVLSGVSTSMAQLIIFRAVQGLGAGALIPLGMTIIGDVYTVEERARMQAYFSGVWGLASVIGPFAGGFITDNLSWRWVFYINVPFGLLAALVIGLSLREPRRQERPAIDYAGAALLMAAITLLMLALVESGSFEALTSGRSLALVGGAVLLGALFAWVERRARDPIVPFRLLGNRVVAVGVGAGFLAGVAMFGAITFIPLFAQGSLGSTATEAGSLLTPLMLSWVFVAIVGGRVLLRVGYRPTAVAGFLLLTAGMALVATYGRDAARARLYLALCLIGAGLGLTMLTLLIAVQQAVTREELGTATSLNQFARSIGGAVGVALMGAVLSAGLATHLGEAARTGALSAERASELASNPNALVEPAAQAALTPAALEALRDALAFSVHRVFWAGTIVSALALLVTLALPRSGQAGAAREPTEEACAVETCERMVITELAVLDPEHEPVAAEGD